MRSRTYRLRALDDQPTELVPDIPLDQYLQSFHYQPPDEPDEIALATRDVGFADGQGAAPAGQTTVRRPAPVEVTTPGGAMASPAAAETRDGAGYCGRFSRHG